MEFSERQKQIINVAIKIVADKGIQNLTTKNIAKDLDLSEAALYRHFKNKLEIIKSIISFFEQKIKQMTKTLDSNEKPLSQIKKFVLAHFKIFRDYPEMAQVMFSESNFQNEANLKEQVLHVMNRSRDSLEAVIKKGQQDGNINNEISSLNLFRIIIGSMRLLVTQWSLSGRIFNLETEGKQLWNDLEKIVAGSLE
ncbi:MAG: TetR/AcrR family transcriptional regulator [Candidatus Cloacimonadota bacterium]|nr:TetR/AcrR family transcriptional regulator [Candidatus Cloacimonadota bacterium]